MSKQQYTEDDQEFANWRETFVSQTYRLFKLCRIHELDNEAAESAIEGTAETFQDILAMGVEYMDVIFAGDNIFVNGKPLRANREVYTTVLELGELLKEVQLNEITIRQGVEAEDLRGMLQYYLNRRDNPKKRQEAIVEPTPAIRYRRIDPKKLLDLDEEADQTADEQVMNLYPAAVVTMRRFVTEIKEKKFRALRFIKRVSQRLVALSDSAPETLLAVTAMKKTRDDEGGIAVNSGVLAMLMGRHLTESYRTLQRLCFGGMAADIGRPRAAGIYDRSSTPNVVPNLNMSGKESLGPSNALLLLRNSRLREPTLRRATVTYEAGWLRYEHDIGWPFGDNRRPTLEAFIVRVSRRFWELMALKPSMNQRRTPQQVFDTLLEEADSRIERAVVRLLMETLAYYEQGTIVELSEGWRGVVVDPGETMAEFPRPVVRIVRDPNGNAIDAQDLDLSDRSLDIGRFGLVRRRLRTVNDDRLRQVARELRPPDWNKKHGRPAKKSRKRSKPRSDKPSPPPDTPSSPREPDKSLGGATSQQLSAAAKKSAADTSSPSGHRAVDSEAGDSEDTGVLEFAPGSAQPKRSGEASGEQSAEEVREISADAIEPASDEQLADGGDADHPRGDDDQDGLLRDHIDSVRNQNEARDPNQIDPAEISGQTDEAESDGGAIAAGTEGGDAIAAGPDEGDTIAPDAATQRMSSEESAETLDNFVEGDVAHDDDTQRMSAEDSAQVLGDFVDDIDDESGDADDATRQVDSAKSQEVLENYVDGGGEPSPESIDEPNDSKLGQLASDIEGKSTETDGGTKRVSSERSHELMRNFVEESSDPSAGESRDGSTGDDEGATAATTNISREQIEQSMDRKSDDSSTAPTANLSRDEIEDFFDEKKAEEDEDDATRQMSAEQSNQILQDYVDDEDSET